MAIKKIQKASKPELELEDILNSPLIENKSKPKQKPNLVFDSEKQVFVKPEN